MIRIERVSAKFSGAALTLAGVVLTALAGCSGTVEPAKVVVPTGAAVVDPNQPPMPVVPKTVAPVNGKAAKGQAKVKK